VQLVLDGGESTPDTVAAAVAAIRDHLSGRRYSEVWLSLSEGRDVSMLVNGNRAWLMYLVNTDEECWHTLGGAEASDRKEVEFRLANGQMDRYPESWVISTEAAVTALEYFLRSGERDPAVSWLRDS